jgi:hypothetical protein
MFMQTAKQGSQAGWHNVYHPCINASLNANSNFDHFLP